MHLCFIDDTESITNVFQRLASMKGHDCIVANDGKTGLSLLKSNSFDVVVLDLAMPEFSGFDVIDTLEQEGILANHNIVVLTGTTISDKELEDLKKRGIKECVRKPTQIQDLFSILQNIVEN